MSEKKSFKLNGAIVKLNQMPMKMAEQAVDISLAAIKDNNTERVRRGGAGGRCPLAVAQLWSHCCAAVAMWSEQEIASQIKAQMEEAHTGV